MQWIKDEWNDEMNENKAMIVMIISYHNYRKIQW